MIFNFAWPLVSQWSVSIIMFDIAYCSWKRPAIAWKMNYYVFSFEQIEVATNRWQHREKLDVHGTTVSVILANDNLKLET